MVHFSRSLHPEAYIEITNALQGIDTDEEFQSAVKHLRRGKRDCYKMVLFQLGDELASAFTAIEIAHGIVDPALKRRLRGIRMKRMKLYAQETVGGAVTDGLQDLVDDMLQLQEDLFSKYTHPTSTVSRLRALWFKSKKTTGWLLSGIAMALIGAIVLAMVFPNNNPILKLNTLMSDINLPVQINVGQESKSDPTSAAASNQGTNQQNQ